MSGQPNKPRLLLRRATQYQARRTLPPPLPRPRPDELSSCTQHLPRIDNVCPAYRTTTRIEPLHRRTPFAPDRPPQFPRCSRAFLSSCLVARSVPASIASPTHSTEFPRHCSPQSGLISPLHLPLHLGSTVIWNLRRINVASTFTSLSICPGSFLGLIRSLPTRLPLPLILHFQSLFQVRNGSKRAPPSDFSRHIRRT